MLYIELTLVILLVVEARWRFAWLRILLVFLFVLSLWAVNLGPAYRRAIAVAIDVPASSTLSSEYGRGVRTMLEEGQGDLKPQIAFPSIALAWLAISPVLLDRMLPFFLAAWRQRQPRGET